MSNDLEGVLFGFVLFSAVQLLFINSSLSIICRVMRWHVDYIRDPERAKRNPPR